jgi:hypothetical protein
VSGFSERHPDTVASLIPDGVMLESADGSRATITSPVPLPVRPAADLAPVDPLEVAQNLADLVDRPRVVGVILIRRGGYAAALVSSGQVVRSSVGRRRVHGRSSAGGWSQQRFARRRDNQTDAVVEAAVRTAAQILLTGPSSEALITGGDKDLIRRALATSQLRDLRDVPRGVHLPVGDPRMPIVHEVAKNAQSFRIDVSDRGPGEDVAGEPGHSR